MEMNNDPSSKCKWMPIVSPNNCRTLISDSAKNHALVPETVSGLDHETFDVPVEIGVVIIAWHHTAGHRVSAGA